MHLNAGLLLIYLLETKSYMKIIIESPDMKLSPSLKTFAETKISKLERIYNQIQSAELTLRTEHKKSGEVILSTLNLRLPGKDEYLKASSPIYEDAILKLVENAQRRLRIRKTQNMNNRTSARRERSK